MLSLNSKLIRKKFFHQSYSHALSQKSKIRSSRERLNHSLFSGSSGRMQFLITKKRLLKMRLVE
jgi:hypothetical protein